MVDHTIRHRVQFKSRQDCLLEGFLTLKLHDVRIISGKKCLRLELPDLEEDATSIYEVCVKANLSVLRKKDTLQINIRQEKHPGMIDLLETFLISGNPSIHIEKHISPLD